MPSTTTIFLIRHGQKLPEIGDPGLTEIGFQQAQETGRWLQQFPIEKIISSPLKRTTQTAREIATLLGQEYSQDDALRERMNWSDPALSRDDFIAEWTRSTQDRAYIPRFGDSSLATGQRMQTLVQTIVREHRSAVLVTHGGAILDYLRTVFGDDALAQIAFQYPKGQDFQMMNCAINRVTFSATPKLELLNFTDHLTHPSE